MSPARKLQRLTLPEADRLQVIAHEFEHLAEALRARAVTTRDLGDTGLQATLAGLREMVGQAAAVIKGR